MPRFRYLGGDGNKIATNKQMTNLVPIDRIENRIYLIRGQKVMIDRDLAELYEVETKHLNRQDKRNIERFPKEFTFKLTKKERDELVPIWHHLSPIKYSHSLPYAFTEHGIAMLSSILKSPLAIKINIHIIKTFIRLRQFIASHTELSQKVKELEQKTQNHDVEIQAIIKIIKKLIAKPEKPKSKIGFLRERE